MDRQAVYFGTPSFFVGAYQKANFSTRTEPGLYCILKSGKQFR